MTKFIKSLFLVSFLLSLPILALAVLPPFYQGKEELIAILKNPKLKEILGSGSIIENIHHFENTYYIMSLDRLVECKVHYLPNDSDLIGKPARFKLEFIETGANEKKKN